MFELDIQVLLLSHTCHVHQTRAVGSCNEFRPRIHVAFHLVLTHLLTYCSFLNREHSSKATALIRALWFNYFDSLFQFEKILDLVELRFVLLAGRTESQFTNAMTGVVQTHLVWELPRQLVNLHHIMNFGGRRFTAEVLNTGEVVHSMKELVIPATYALRGDMR